MLPKAIILIGPDKAGKTTLSQGLLAEFPGMVYSKGVKTESFDATKDRVAKLIGEMTSSVYPYLFDRFHYPDELIYSSLNRETEVPKELDFFFNRYVVDALNKLGTVILYCTADLEDLERRFIASGETDIKVEWLKSLQDRYTQFLVRECKLPYAVLDSSKLNQAQMLETAVRLINYYDNPQEPAGCGGCSSEDGCSGGCSSR